MIEFIKNLNVEKIKEKGQPLALAGVCFVAVFIAGFGTGKMTSSTNNGTSTSKRSLTNYTTNTSVNTSQTQNNPQSSSQTTVAPKEGNSSAIDPVNCYIKGSKSKTYHIPGGAFYERTTPAACFNSEEEATAAGYKKSSR